MLKMVRIKIINSKTASAVWHGERSEKCGFYRKAEGNNSSPVQQRHSYDENGGWLGGDREGGAGLVDVGVWEGVDVL